MMMKKKNSVQSRVSRDQAAQLLNSSSMQRLPKRDEVLPLIDPSQRRTVQKQPKKKFATIQSAKKSAAAGTQQQEKLRNILSGSQSSIAMLNNNNTSVGSHDLPAQGLLSPKMSQSRSHRKLTSIYKHLQSETRPKLGQLNPKLELTTNPVAEPFELETEDTKELDLREVDASPKNQQSGRAIQSSEVYKSENKNKGQAGDLRKKSPEQSLFTDIASRETDKSRRMDQVVMASIASPEKSVNEPPQTGLIQIKVPTQSDFDVEKSFLQFNQTPDNLQSNKRKGTVLSRPSLGPDEVSQSTTTQNCFITRSKSGFYSVQSRFESVRNKQERDLERWKRQLQLETEKSEQNLMKSRSLERILEHKTNVVLEMQQKRQLDAKMKNETALARVKANESKILAERHQTQLTKHKMQLELERKRSADREQKSQERLQASLERNTKIKSTIGQADSILSERRRATLDVIERKRQLELDRKARQDVEKRQLNLIAVQRQHQIEEKVNKAKSDLSQKIDSQLRQQQKRISSYQSQQEQNRSNLEKTLERKRQREMESKQRVELSAQMLQDKQDEFASKLNDKKQRVDMVKKQEAEYNRQQQIRQKQILLEKARIQASLNKLRSQ